MQVETHHQSEALTLKVHSTASYTYSKLTLKVAIEELLPLNTYPLRITGRKFLECAGSCEDNVKQNSTGQSVPIAIWEIVEES